MLAGRSTTAPWAPCSACGQENPGWTLQAAVFCQASLKMPPDEVYPVFTHNQLWLSCYGLHCVSDMNICFQQPVDVICFCPWERACDPEHHFAQVLWLLGGCRYGATQGWGYLKLGISPALEEVEPPPRLTTWSFLVQRQHFPPVVCPARWSSSITHKWAVGPQFELNLHALLTQRKTFSLGYELVLEVFPVSVSLISHHPFKNWTTDLDTACCITTFLPVLQAQNPPLCFSLFIAPHLTASH